MRAGNTAVPGATWSDWQPVAASGGALSLTGRYLQYRAVLATTDSAVTPVLEQVTASHGEPQEPPANTAPVAVADAYETDAGTPLSVSAPGVLGNDTDADNDTLTAVKASDPEHGTLTLNADGSFIYTPAAGYSGPDSFTYTANDGTDGSNTATVTITVNAPEPAPLVDTTAADFGAGTLDASPTSGRRPTASCCCCRPSAPSSAALLCPPAGRPPRGRPAAARRWPPAS